MHLYSMPIGYRCSRESYGFRGPPSTASASCVPKMTAHTHSAGTGTMDCGHILLPQRIASHNSPLLTHLLSLEQADSLDQAQSTSSPPDSPSSATQVSPRDQVSHSLELLCHSVPHNQLLHVRNSAPASVLIWIFSLWTYLCPLEV